MAYNPDALTGMRTAHVTTNNGTQWSTSINGTNKSIHRYFMGKSFNVGTYPEEKMEIVTNLVIV